MARTTPTPVSDRAGGCSRPRRESVLLAEENHLRESRLRVEERLGLAHRADQHPEGLQRRLCPAHETIAVRGGESSRKAIPIGAVGWGNMARGSRTGHIRVTHEKKLKRTSTGRPRPSANRLGQAARLRDGAKEAMELNSRTRTDGHRNCYRNAEPFTHEQRACAIQQLLDTATRTALLSIYPGEFPPRIWRDRLG